jgi:hypothetical protein
MMLIAVVFFVSTCRSANPADVARHDRMVSLVERILALHKQLPEARTPHEKTALQRRIEPRTGRSTCWSTSFTG